MSEREESLREQLRALELLRLQIRRAQGDALYLDAYDRWGNPGDREELEAQLGEVSTRRSVALRELTARIEALREAGRHEVIEAWASAHVALLDHFLAKTTDSVARSVASGERERWEAMARGEAGIVEENVFYVSDDRALHASLFGAFSDEELAG
jgi:hypothetical protein